jgi:hypothetical protein
MKLRRVFMTKHPWVDNGLIVSADIQPVVNACKPQKRVPAMPGMAGQPCMAAATIWPMAMHMDPTTMPRATFFFSMISVHSL